MVFFLIAASGEMRFMSRIWAVSLLGPPHPTFFFKPLFFISHQAVDFGD
jgi:hypothetical protein